MLLEGRSLDDLTRALSQPPLDVAPSFVTWNVRWLVDPHALANVRKRLRIRRWLEAGRIVLLQETHWAELDCGVWSTLFPASTTISSPAITQAGGVAIIVPAGIEVINHQVLVPGYAIIAHLRYRDKHVRVLSLYIPPASATTRLLGLQRHLRFKGHPSSWAATSTTTSLHRNPRPGTSTGFFEACSLLEIA